VITASGLRVERPDRAGDDDYREQGRHFECRDERVGGTEGALEPELRQLDAGDDQDLEAGKKDERQEQRADAGETVAARLVRARRSLGQKPVEQPDRQRNCHKGEIEADLLANLNRGFPQQLVARRCFPEIERADPKQIRQTDRQHH
jgi:hypothetical protein